MRYNTCLGGICPASNTLRYRNLDRGFFSCTVEDSTRLNTKNHQVNKRINKSKQTKILFCPVRPFLGTPGDIDFVPLTSKLLNFYIDLIRAKERGSEDIVNPK